MAGDNRPSGDAAVKQEVRIEQRTPEATSSQEPRDHPRQRGAQTNGDDGWTPAVVTWAVILIVALVVVWGDSVSWPTGGRIAATVGIGLFGVALPVFLYMRMKPGLHQIARKIGDWTAVASLIMGPALLVTLLAPNDQIIAAKLFVIAFFSFLPPWLYLQFIANRGNTLWDEYVVNLHRLGMDRSENLPEPPVDSVFHSGWTVACGLSETDHAPDIRGEVYRKKFEGLFGAKSSTQAEGALRAENLGPVGIATLMFSLGWVLVVKPDGLLSLSVIAALGLPVSDITGPANIDLDAAAFAFLGAYFYILQMLVRRYFQNDLKTSAYVSAAMRIIIAVLLAIVVSLAWPANADQDVLLATAFIIGVFPDTGWELLRTLVQHALRVVVPSMRKAYPLSDLDGLNLWYESRLLEEGIEDMQNLATSNIVDVMLQTRIPLDRLVDWIDQALLFLHLPAKDGEARRSQLRANGIRCATDLEDVHEQDDQLFGRVAAAVSNGEGPAILLDSVVATFRREPNLYHVRLWKSFAERLKAA